MNSSTTNDKFLCARTPPIPFSDSLKEVLKYRLSLRPFLILYAKAQGNCLLSNRIDAHFAKLRGRLEWRHNNCKYCTS
jgi:hypothetical protein